MKYSTFFQRVLATLIDIVIFLPLFIGYMWVRSYFGTVSIILYILGTVLQYFYRTYFLWRWGQTLGKAIFKLKVVNLDGSRIGLKSILLRQSVEIVISIMFLSGTLYGSLHLPSDFTSLSWIEQSRIQVQVTPSYVNDAVRLTEIWVIAEIIIMLTNHKRRAIHDFIAGTVVIKTK